MKNYYFFIIFSRFSNKYIFNCNAVHLACVSNMTKIALTNLNTLIFNMCSNKKGKNKKFKMKYDKN